MLGRRLLPLLHDDLPSRNADPAARGLLEALTLPSGVYEVARERRGLVSELT